MSIPVTTPSPRLRIGIATHEALRHAVIVATAVSRAMFWVVTLHLFGSEALLILLAAWTFLNGIRDLTFARIRLARVLDASRRGRALVKSVAMESALTLFRLGLALVLLQVLRMVHEPLAAMFQLFLPAVLLWSRETLLVLTRAYGMTHTLRSIRLCAALSGLVAVVLVGNAGAGPASAAALALVLRETLFFSCYCVVVLAGRFLPSARRAEDCRDADPDGDGQDVGSEAHLEGIRSSTQRFLVDNATYARWRVLQIGSRAVANGLFGPLGTILSQVFFSYQQPGRYSGGRSNAGQRRRLLVLVGAPVAAGLALGLAWEFNLLAALGLMAFATVFRVVSLAGNLLFWSRLSRNVFRP